MRDRAGEKKRALYGWTRIGIYPGQYFDVETGLHYNLWRYYEPGIGRYLRTDPIHKIYPRLMSIPHLTMSSLMYPSELNYYVYVTNNVNNAFDAFGLMGCKPKDLENGEGNLCFDSIRNKVGKNICDLDIDKWSNKIDNPCFICCMELIPSTLGGAVLICEGVCIAGVKSMKEERCKCPQEG